MISCLLNIYFTFILLENLKINNTILIFKEIIDYNKKNLVEEQMRRSRGSGPVYYTDSSKLECSSIGTSFILDRKRDKGKLKDRKWYLGKNKKVFDTECFAIAKALENMRRKHRIVVEKGKIWTSITIRVDLTLVIRRVTKSTRGKGQI